MILRFAAIALALLASPIAAAAAPLRVMTFNVRLPIDKEPERTWKNRLPVAVAMLRRTAPDIIGTQELHKRQGDDIVAKLPNYAWVGIDRRGGHADEHMGLFYRRDRLTLIDFGNWWLSDTPDVPGSITWGHPLPRMVTWGLFERKADKRRVYVLNTHFPYRAEDEDARVKGARLIQARIAALPADVAVVLLGDFNTTPDSAVHATLSADLADAHGAARERKGPDTTFHAFTGKADRRIDWIFARGLIARQVETVTDHRGAVQTSDHFPVIAELDWR